MTLTLPAAPPARRPATPALPPPVSLAGRYDGPTNLQEQMVLARALSQAYGTVPRLYRGNPANVLAAIYSARTLDIGVMTALQQLYFDNGHCGMTGSLMQGLILRARHKILVVHADAKAVAMELHRCDDQPAGRASWTINEAAVAGLTTRETWRSYPSDMLFWRCMARLARRHAADVVHGFGHIPDELIGLSDEDLPEDSSAEPTVDEDVQTLLADLDTLDVDGLHALLDNVRTTGAAQRFAGTVDGVHLTVEQLVATRIERLILTGAQAAHAAGPDESTADVGSLPAGEGVLECGCLTKVVLGTGWHRLGCAEQGDVFAEDLGLGVMP